MFSTIHTLVRGSSQFISQGSILGSFHTSEGRKVEMWGSKTWVQVACFVLCGSWQSRTTPSLHWKALCGFLAGGRQTPSCRARPLLPRGEGSELVHTKGRGQGTGARRSEMRPHVPHNRGRCFYHPHFTGGETKAQRGAHTLVSPQVSGEGDKMQNLILKVEDGAPRLWNSKVLPVSQVPLVHRRHRNPRVGLTTCPPSASGWQGPGWNQVGERETGGGKG